MLTRLTTPTLLCLGLLLLGIAGCDSSSNPTARQPNFIVILADDLDWAPIDYLPRLHSLAQEGLAFTNFFAPSAICAPSRVTFLRGQYTHNHRVLTNQSPQGAYPKMLQEGIESSTIATWMQSAGYRTIYLGKYMNEYPSGVADTYVPPGWDEWYVPVHGLYFDLRINDTGKLVDYPGCCEDYETDLEARRAADFIRRTAADTVPFLVYLSPNAPHLPSTPAPRHEAAFSGVVAPRTPSFNEEDVSDKPATIAQGDPLSPEQIDRMDGIFRDRLRTMLAVEELMDTVLAALEEAGVRENTYVFFTSDNGWHYGEHRMRWGKTTSYNEDINVPLFVLGPGIPAGQEVDEIALSIDLAPTIAELGGAVPPAFVDGRSLTPLLQRSVFPLPEWRRGSITQRWRPNPDTVADYIPYWLLGYRGLRTDDYLYAEWDTGEFELYDRRTDPFEMENMYDTADPALLQELSAWLDRLSTCSGGGCALAEAGM